MNEVMKKTSVLLVSRTTAFKVIYNSHKYLYNYS